jgi:hypothetical protein
LPDYLILVDDDTLYDLDAFAEHMPRDVEVPRVYAGCVLGADIRELRFPSPIGGFGTIFSRGALKRMIQPVDCTASKEEPLKKDAYEHSTNFCSCLDKDRIGEGELHRPGMSVSDLMAAYSNRAPFCMHSDWVVGYFVNFYHLSVPAQYDGYDVDEARLHEYDGSKNCGNTGTKCLEMKSLATESNFSASSHVCHYVNDTIMHEVMVKMRAMVPTHYPQIED